MKKIGILGGTFNPIHTGHIVLAEQVREKLDLDYILFIPSYYPPHKKPVKLISAKHRYSMVNLAIKHNPFFRNSDIEIKRRGKSYTIDTLLGLSSIYKNQAKFFFIIGSDSFSGLHSWKNLGGVMKLCKLVAVTRPGYKYKYKGVKTINLNTFPISSTDIRQRVKNGRSIRYLVPENVREYILKNKLYT